MKRYLMICFIVLQIISVNLGAVGDIIDIVDFSRENYYPLKHWLINPQSKKLFRPPIS